MAKSPDFNDHASNQSKSFMNCDPTVQYLADHSLRKTEVQKAIEEVTKQHSVGIMMGAPEVLQLTANIMKMINAKKALDVGTFTGCSALSAALAVADDGEVHAMDIESHYVDIGRPFWEQAGVAHKIKVHIAPATETLDKLVAQGHGGTFDFAFIDADKVNYKNYYETCLTLLRSGGFVAMDNTLYGGQVYDPTYTNPNVVAMRAFNEFVKDDQRVNISFLGIGDGLTLLFKK